MATPIAALVSTCSTTLSRKNLFTAIGGIPISVLVTFLAAKHFTHALDAFTSTVVYNTGPVAAPAVLQRNGRIHTVFTALETSLTVVACLVIDVYTNLALGAAVVRA